MFVIVILSSAKSLSRLQTISSSIICGSTVDPQILSSLCPPPFYSNRDLTWAEDLEMKVRKKKTGGRTHD
jgi:hypothetical protein